MFCVEDIVARPIIGATLAPENNHWMRTHDEFLLRYQFPCSLKILICRLILATCLSATCGQPWVKDTSYWYAENSRVSCRKLIVRNHFSPQLSSDSTATHMDAPVRYDTAQNMRDSSGAEMEGLTVSCYHVDQEDNWFRVGKPY